jgi:predicted ATP-binding protein involved in virulence
MRVLQAHRDGETTQAVDELEAVRKAIEAMLPGVTNSRIDSETGRFVVDWKSPSGENVKLFPEQLSGGYQAMLGVVMDFALRMAIANPRKSRKPLEQPAILMIDEIDLHLHPSWQQKVIENLRGTFPNTQLILTTHSPQVPSTVAAQNIRVLANVDGKTELQTPSFQTRGVMSADVLAQILGVDPIPDVPEARWLRDYQALIDDGQHNTQEAARQRDRLISHFGEKHPVILECDRLIRFTEFKKKKLAVGNAST